MRVLYSFTSINICGNSEVRGLHRYAECSQSEFLHNKLSAEVSQAWQAVSVSISVVCDENIMLTVAKEVLT